MSLRRIVWLIDAFIQRHRKLSLFLIFLTVASLLIARSLGETAIKTGILNLFSEDKFSEGLVGAPQTLNPLFVTTDSELDLSKLIFRGLTKTDFTGQTVGDLAESWESSGGQTYLFHLKPNLHFQNGDVITAQDVAATYSAAKSAEVGSPLADTLKGLDIQVISDTDILFRLPDPFAPFLSLTDLGILPKKTLDKIPAKDLRLSKFNINPIGSGDFRLVSIDSEKATLLRGNTTFEFRFYDNQDDLVTALKLGEIKAAGLSQNTNLKSWSNLQQLASPLYRRFVGIFYNERGGVTTDRNVRYGLSLALDKDKLAALGNGEKAVGPIPPVSWAVSNNFRKFDQNIASAKDNFDKAGWSGGPVRNKDSKYLEITLSFIDLPQLQALANEISVQWAQVGVRAILRPLSPIDFKTKVVDGKDFQAAIVTQEIGVDPDQYVLWHSLHTDSTNLTGVKVPKIDKSLEDGRQTNDLDQRKAIYASFQRYFMEEAPVTFLYYPKYTYYVSDKVSGINLQPLGVPTDRFNNVSDWKINRTLF